MGNRLNHAEEGIHIIEEYFEFEERQTEEEKLQEGLKYGVEHGILTTDEASQCYQAFLRNRGE